MAKKRATKAELIKRREEIQQLILKGVNATDIQKIVGDKWGASPRAVREDLKWIREQWEQSALESTQLMRNKYAERLELLFNRAWSDGHLKTCLEIQKEISKLNGMYKEKETDDSKLPEFINVSKKGELKVVGGEDE